MRFIKALRSILTLWRSYEPAMVGWAANLLSMFKSWWKEGRGVPSSQYFQTLNISEANILTFRRVTFMLCFSHDGERGVRSSQYFQALNISGAIFDTFSLFYFRVIFKSYVRAFWSFLCLEFPNSQYFCGQFFILCSSPDGGRAF